MICTELFAHSLDKLETLDVSGGKMVKQCAKCGYKEELPYSQSIIYYSNNILSQQKKWAADENAKELLQPADNEGNANPEFTEAFGYNPFDERTKHKLPNIQKGL